MADESWRKTEGTWDRLKWARKRVFATGKDAAEALGVPENTYRAYERQPDSSKHIPLTHVHAGHFAKRLKVRWEWLLKGEGEPWIPGAAKGKARAHKAIDAVSDDQAEVIAEMIERMLKTGTDG